MLAGAAKTPKDDGRGINLSRPSFRKSANFIRNEYPNQLVLVSVVDLSSVLVIGLCVVVVSS
jgi:hypothetical protein